MRRKAVEVEKRGPEFDGESQPPAVIVEGLKIVRIIFNNGGLEKGERQLTLYCGMRRAPCSLQANRPIARCVSAR